MRIRLFMIAGIFAILQYGGYSQTNGEVLSNKSIIDLHKAGIEEELIIAKIQSSECKFDLSTAGMIDLKNKGVPSNLIKIMMNKADGKPIIYLAPQNSQGLSASNSSFFFSNYSDHVSEMISLQKNYVQGTILSRL